MRFQISGSQVRSLQSSFSFFCFSENERKMRLPGVEPGSTAWKAAILTVRPQSLLTKLRTRAENHLPHVRRLVPPEQGCGSDLVVMMSALHAERHGFKPRLPYFQRRLESGPCALLHQQVTLLWPSRLGHWSYEPRIGGSSPPWSIFVSCTSGASCKIRLGSLFRCSIVAEQVALTH